MRPQRCIRHYCAKLMRNGGAVLSWKCATLLHRKAPMLLGMCSRTLRTTPAIRGACAWASKSLEAMPAVLPGPPVLP